MTTVGLTFGQIGAPAVVGAKKCLMARPGEIGTIMYGPYEERPAGRYRVTVEVGLAEGPPPVGNSVCTFIDVVAGEGLVLLAERFVLYSELKPGLSQFSLDFELQEPRELEYRIHSTGQVQLNVSGEAELVIISEPAPSFSPAGSRERAWAFEREFLDGYLRNISGLIHVGANLGQERRYYWLLGVGVIWVEPIKEIYDKLVDNISRYPRQHAINALLSDRHGTEFEFLIASNNGASSSILPFEDHAILYPDIQYIERRTILSTTLERLMIDKGISLDQYQALTLDVEGAELLVLQGGGSFLSQFQYIKCEAADFPARTGSPTASQLDAFLTKAGFTELMRKQCGMGPAGRGTYWDIVWKRVTAGQPVQLPGVALPMVANPTEVDGIEKCE